ncbi:MAG: YraN family protein [Gammaproteobacteria bacterium RBG_16_57_12]|nr:MAG: YraN family protein [Gammaproteobacteria bacterium RBG_16_57_12]
MTATPPRQPRGQAAEDLACNYLCGQGLQLLERNYLCKSGEIDLIMQDRDCLVFVEVRYRQHPRYGSALESVTRQKQARLCRTAEHYLQCHTNQRTRPCRFDVLGISPGTGPATEIQWIKDAFQA